VSEQQQPWYAPAGELAALTDPAYELWWLVTRQQAEHAAALADLELPREARRRLQRLALVHARELATLAGHPEPPVALQPQRDRQQQG